MALSKITNRFWGIFGLLLFIAIVLLFVRFFIVQKDSMIYLTAILIAITAYYAWATYGLLEQARESARAGIRPLIIATRLSEKGEIGAFAGEEGINRVIHLMNVGSGHAHRVNIRLSPPAEAYARGEKGVQYEGSIYVIHGVEMPINSKRMWNNLGAFCNQNNWHYMYAEYEDMEGNQYYTIQSGYNVKTGRIKELRQKVRKKDTDTFWENKKKENWLDDIDITLKEWAQQQRETFQKRNV